MAAVIQTSSLGLSFWGTRGFYWVIKGKNNVHRIGWFSGEFLLYGICLSEYPRNIFENIVAFILIHIYALHVACIQ